MLPFEVLSSDQALSTKISQLYTGAPILFLYVLLILLLFLFLVIRTFMYYAKGRIIEQENQDMINFSMSFAFTLVAFAQLGLVLGGSTGSPFSRGGILLIPLPIFFGMTLYYLFILIKNKIKPKKRKSR